MSAVQPVSRAAGAAYQLLEVHPIAGALGAEIYGVDLRDRANKPMWEELHRAFLEYSVIAVRGQNLSPAEQYEVGRVFGEPCFYPFAKGMDGFPEMTRMVKEPEERENFGADWHTDTCYLQEPPRATLLYAVETPPKGGDTLYASTRAAYDALSDGMKAMLDGVIGVNSAGLKHKRGGDRAAHHARIAHMAVQNANEAEKYEARHPIVRTHPETGKKALYLSSLHTIRFDGMTEHESRPIIVMLNDHCVEPQFTCRVRWEPGQLTIWDNRCVLHNAINDYHGYRREMRRLTVGAEKPR
jgi:taurine dioxygenase